MYSRAVLSTDYSAGAARAADALRPLLEPGATVRALHVSSRPDAPEGLSAADRAVYERYQSERATASELGLRAWAEKLDLPGLAPVVRYGSVSREVAAEAASSRAEIVAVGSRGLSTVERVMLGSKARAILRHVHDVDVLVARGTVSLKGYHRILVATDFFGPSKAAGHRALEVARSRPDAELIAFHAIDPDMWETAVDVPDRPKGQPAVAWLREQMQGMLHAFNEQELAGKAREVLLAGRPAHEAAEYAREQGVDLIVVGTHGPGRVERALLGSVAEAIVERAPCPVLVVRSQT